MAVTAHICWVLEIQIGDEQLFWSQMEWIFIFAFSAFFCFFCFFLLACLFGFCTSVDANMMNDQLQFDCV